MKIVVSLLAVLGLIVVAYAGTAIADLQFVFGVVIPYVASATFVVGVVLKITGWMRSAVPFNITTTTGQQKSLSWIKNDEMGSPSNQLSVIGRMLTEVFLFRSLFRNTRSSLYEGRLIHDSNKWLWVFGLVFHYSFLLVFLRHYRFFSGPEIPALFMGIETMDSILQVGVPTLYLTDLLLVGGATLLFARRILVPQIRYISFAADYFPLLLILAIAFSGIAMRYALRVDIMSVKELTMGLVTFQPVVPGGIEPIFYIHLFLVSVLFAYFPFSKLMHAGGVWLSPTRNMAANTRQVRHVNPWNKPIKIRTYEEYEDDFRKPMMAAGLPVEKEEIKEKE